MSIGVSVGTVRISVFYRRAHIVVGCALHGLGQIELLKL